MRWGCFTVLARGGFEAVKRIVRRKPVSLDRLRVAIGDLDCQFASDRETRRFDGGEWPCPLGLVACASLRADPPAGLATLHGESRQNIGEFVWRLLPNGLTGSGVPAISWFGVPIR